MAQKDAFRPLGEPEFAVLEDRWKVRVPARLRMKLNWELERLCSFEGDRFVHGEAKPAAEMRASIARDAGNLLATLRKLEAAIKPGAAIEPGARLAAWHLFPFEHHDNPYWFPEESREEGRPSPLIVKLEALCWLAERAAPRLPEPKSVRGYPANYWLDCFICVVADAFDDAGGTVSAAVEKEREDGGQRQRDTRFLRGLFYIHDRLPAHRRAPSEKALAERVDRLITRVTSEGDQVEAPSDGLGGLNPPKKPPRKKQPKEPTRKKPSQGKKRG